ncbi:MAG: glutamine amidotransferase family protein [Desulfotomaculum sp.]|nr:glutamine amidotransferase family protein [Desulfotomaculum sp.]
MIGTFPRIPSGCAISGMMSRRARHMTGEAVIKSIALMHDRSNGLGGGFAAYGIYPDFKDHYAFHILYNSKQNRIDTENYLKDKFVIDRCEPIPTRNVEAVTDPPIIWRYFLKIEEKNLYHNNQLIDERDYVVNVVMHINNKIDGAFVMSSGKNMGAFKGVGYPEDIGRFFCLDEYEAYIWTAHGRFPTNTPGWWGGAHPFCLLDWSVVHNGEISSYGINKRYLEMFGYKCELQTDTEVVAYLVDLLHRKQGIPLDLTCKALASPFWKDIDKMKPEQREVFTVLRQVYGSALLNGPFSFIIANSGAMIGLNDRIKLRPMTVGVKDDMVYMASEESAIREICPDLDEVWAAKAGEPIIVELEEGVKV